MPRGCGGRTPGGGEGWPQTTGRPESPRAGRGPVASTATCGLAVRPSPGAEPSRKAFPADGVATSPPGSWRPVGSARPPLCCPHSSKGRRGVSVVTRLTAQTQRNWELRVTEIPRNPTRLESGRNTCARRLALPGVCSVDTAAPLLQGPHYSAAGPPTSGAHPGAPAGEAGAAPAVGRGVPAPGPSQSSRAFWDTRERYGPRPAHVRPGGSTGFRRHPEPGPQGRPPAERLQPEPRGGQARLSELAEAPPQVCSRCGQSQSATAATTHCPSGSDSGEGREAAAGWPGPVGRAQSQVGL